MKQFVLMFVCHIFLAVSFLLADSDNGFTIIVGKDAGDAGCVMVAHNEDAAGKNLYADVQIIPPAAHIRGAVVALKKNPVIPQVTMTLGFLRMQIPGIDSSDSYVNREGVVITSNACKSREDRPEFTGNGIDLLLIRLMAERASSAREAVEIAGRLVEIYGYYASGRSFAIADAKEAWHLQIVSGKHWVAQRVPDDQVAVVANCYTIETVNLKDKNNFLGSEDLVDYAVKRRWYQPDRDGPFNFSRVYSTLDNWDNRKNILRRWRAFNLITNKKNKLDYPIPFAFPVSKKSITLFALFRVLRDHYEDTEYDLTDNYKKGSPNSTTNRTICTDTTRYSFIAELRIGFPREIANRIWVAFRRPDSNAYSPWYDFMPVLPDGYAVESAGATLKSYSQQSPPPVTLTPDYAYWHYAKLSELVDRDYKVYIKPVTKEWDNFEDYALKSLKKMEKEFDYLLKTDKRVAEKIITNYIHRLEYRKWFLAIQLTQQLEKK
ncbi:MAG: Dipeptidase [Acidobacteriota bacterium]|nr:Dipeptidase [Acidobacteriota bacterium]